MFSEVDGVNYLQLGGYTMIDDYAFCSVYCPFVIIN